MSNRYFGGNLTNYGEAPTTVEYLVVAGGGGGGNTHGGGGGAGGLLTAANFAVAGGSALPCCTTHRADNRSTKTAFSCSSVVSAVQASFSQRSLTVLAAR